ncbi:hypothetical protein Pst134EA_006735 [Puccinia striiformis f. sp. tritici]|uniref:hypothetical protein n=1 Tax=Puccinia striiformis f. sp. tritici TaxID=168172 RepID=UPI002008671C|nr:hypothetical protein Pst134EA_006735 [Puccinia striiformis f. sp. tritici]KAH9469446.1 hypothetical protein Pst134EA_006735 [Puccinia striiformis f. sp. tritici]
MVAEITTAENQALAFSLLPTSYAVGSAIGPLLGGYLSRPAERFPNSWFATSQFWQNHPWLLPCAVAAIAPLLGLVMATLWLNETLPKKKSINTEREPLLQSQADIDVQESLVPAVSSPTKILDLLKDRNLLVILISYSLLSFQTISLEALIVLFAYTPVKSGGDRILKCRYRIGFIIVRSHGNFCSAWAFPLLPKTAWDCQVIQNMHVSVSAHFHLIPYHSLHRSK